MTSPVIGSHSGSRGTPSRRRILVTVRSGTPVIDTPGAGQAGTILSGNLEQSNVSTSTALVDLIQYQQAYEANATTIQTEQTDFTRLSQI